MNNIIYVIISFLILDIVENLRMFLESCLYTIYFYTNV